MGVRANREQSKVAARLTSPTPLIGSADLVTRHGRIGGLWLAVERQRFSIGPQAPDRFRSLPLSCVVVDGCSVKFQKRLTAVEVVRIRERGYSTGIVAVTVPVRSVRSRGDHCGVAQPEIVMIPKGDMPDSAGSFPLDGVPGVASMSIQRAP
jgi:hypothetical protein